MSRIFRVDVGATSQDNRLFREALCWRLRSGSPLRGLPLATEKISSSHFTDGSKAEFFTGFSRTLAPPRCTHRKNDSSGLPEVHPVMKASQHQAIECSRAGLTSKIVALVDALCNLLRFLPLPEQAPDTICDAQPISVAIDKLPPNGSHCAHRRSIPSAPDVRAFRVNICS
ncbi:hypothetical protein [Yoonia sp.]|uniref:hypothetical protein n=1 Tax=Yoonia sp. TaxID=2212373 RepID=UPI00358F3F78